jgi:hypothetical protein
LVGCLTEKEEQRHKKSHKKEDDLVKKTIEKWKIQENGFSDSMRWGRRERRGGSREIDREEEGREEE